MRRFDKGRRTFLELFDQACGAGEDGAIMQRKALGILFLCLVLLAAIVLGYWDMLNSEKLRISQAQDPAGTQPFATAQTDDDGPPLPERAFTGDGEPASETSAEPAAPQSEIATISVDEGSPDDPAAAANVSGQASGSGGSKVAGGSGDGPDPAAEASAGDVPLFDLLRVEPDGSTVIVGRAAPGSRVTLQDGDTTIGSDTANAAGEFVVVLPEPLQPGAHAITIIATTPEGSATASRETAIVSVPEAGQAGELLAMVETPDQPSRLINVPTSPPDQIDEAGGQAGESAASGASAGAQPEPRDSASLDEPPDVSSETGGKEAAILPRASNGEEAGEPAQRVDQPMLRIEAVEVEGGKMFVAGTADAGTSVRVYVDNTLLAEGRASADDRFLVTAEREVAVGEHLVRVDQLTAGGEVMARAEVPFTRPEGVAVAAIAPIADEVGTGEDAVESNFTGTRDEGAAAQNAEVTAPASGLVPTQNSGAPDDQDSAGAPATDLRAVPPEATTPAGEVVPTNRQAPLATANGRVIIRKGDTLWGISRETYGRGSRYTAIYLANGNRIRDPDLIYPGQVFRLPEIQDETEEVSAAEAAPKGGRDE